MKHSPGSEYGLLLKTSSTYGVTEMGDDVWTFFGEKSDSASEREEGKRAVLTVAPVGRSVGRRVVRERDKKEARASSASYADARVFRPGII